MARSLSARCKLRHRLALHAHEILSELTTIPSRTLRVCVRSKIARVCIEVNQGNPTETPRPPQYPGCWLSGTGQLIWDALGEEWLVGKQIAARIRRDYDAKLKHLLMDMEDRGVLLHEDGKGYARAPLPGSQSSPSEG